MEVFQRFNVLLECLLHVLLFALYRPLGPTVILSLEVYSCLDSGPETGRL